MNILQKSTLAFYAPIILFFPQLFLSFRAITNNVAVFVDWLLLTVAIIALLLSGLYIWKTTQVVPKWLGHLYIAVAIGSTIFAIITVL